MDSLQPSASADDGAVAMTTSPALTVAQATLFMTDFDGAPAAELERLLAHTLHRLQVSSSKQRVISLIEQPLLGRQSLVRVTPCLVLDTGSREVRIPGELKLLDAALLEGALARH